MARIFKTPFGAQGDTEQVPEAPQGDGSVSLTQGFGYDYEREYEDPAAKDIRREVMNGLFHDITEAIGDIQLSGVAKWDAAAAPYPAGAVVWHDSVAWMSTAGNNSVEPSDGTIWEKIPSRGEIGQRVIYVGSVADLKDLDVPVGAAVRTLGYHSPGDGGGNDYEIVAAGTGTDDGGSFIDLSGSGLQAKGLFGETVSVGQFGAEPGQDSQTGIQSAIDYCINNALPLFWPSYDYISTESFSNFWSVKHHGYGRISRGESSFYITPVGDQVNVIYAGNPDSVGYDGISPDFAIFPHMFRVITRALAEKASDGIWRLQFPEGVVAQRGLRLTELPFFRYPLEFVGTKDGNGDPTTIWDGENNVENVALNTSQRQDSAVVNITVRDIQFNNWSNSAIVAGAYAHVSEENCWVDNCGTTGFWVVSGNHVTKNCKFSNIGVVGVRNQYSSVFNVSNCVFDNMPTGVAAGRMSGGHVAYSEFSNIGAHCVGSYNRSRVRTYGNIYNDWGISAIRADSGIWEHTSGDPDAFLGLGTDKPAVLEIAGGSVPVFRHRSTRFVHRIQNKSPTFVNDPSQRERLGNLDGWLSAFSLPGYSLYSSTALLTLEADLSLGSGMEFTFELVSSGNQVIGSITIPPSTSSRACKLKMELTGPREGLPNGRFTAEAITSEGAFYNSSTTENFSTLGARFGDQEYISFDLYWETDVNAGTLGVFGTRSYFEV